MDTGPESDGLVDALRQRVAALEAENAALLERYVAWLEVENRRISQAVTVAPTALTSSAGTPAGTVGAPAPVEVTQLTAATLARDLTRVEDQLAEVEKLAAIGDMRGAARAKVSAATLACRAFGRVCDDADFRQQMMQMRTLAGSVPSLTLPDTPQADFHSVEVSMLQLVGLTRELATKHVNAAIEAYTQNRDMAVRRMQDPVLLLDDLRALRDATCQDADMLALGLRKEASRQRWRKLLTYGLGGTVIVAANGLGTALLGPAGVAASQVVGSAAVGVAAALIT